jgi:hypothetical protein
LEVLHKELLKDVKKLVSLQTEALQDILSSFHHKFPNPKSLSLEIIASIFPSLPHYSDFPVVNAVFNLPRLYIPLLKR